MTLGPPTECQTAEHQLPPRVSEMPPRAGDVCAASLDAGGLRDAKSDARLMRAGDALQAKAELVLRTDGGRT